MVMMKLIQMIDLKMLVRCAEMTSCRSLVLSSIVESYLPARSFVEQALVKQFEIDSTGLDY